MEPGLPSGEEGGCGSQSVRGCTSPSLERGRETEKEGGVERKREREKDRLEKEKLTPDDAGADKTTNDNVCRAPDCF